MKVGYARVSTADQNLDSQIDALRNFGCERIISEKTSSSRNRPQLEDTLSWLRSGDVFVCTRMDRLARSIQDLIGILNRLMQTGVGVIFLDQSIDTTSAGGRLVFHVFAAIAEFERDLIKERTVCGLDAARSRGRVGGRRKIVGGTKEKALYEMYDSKNYSLRQICETLNLKRRTIYDYLKRRRGRDEKPTEL